MLFDFFYYLCAAELKKHFMRSLKTIQKGKFSELQGDFYIRNMFLLFTMNFYSFCCAFSLLVNIMKQLR